MTNTFVNSELKKLKKNLNDSLSVRFVQKLTNDQKQDIYKFCLVRLFNVQTLDNVFDDSISNVDKLFHFDLMKSTLIKIGKLISEKFKQIDNLANDKEEIKLIEVLNDTIDHPITLPYLIPNLCECTISSIEFLFKHLNNSKSIEVKIDENFDKKLNDKLNKTIDEKLNASAQKTNDSKKIYKIYSNKTSEYYEAKRTTTRKMDTNIEEVKLKDEKKLLEQKVNEIALESNKLHQLNQQYRLNKEELQDELVNLKKKYHKLVHELDEKNSIIEDKQTQFEDLEIELNTIKVQLESIYKQNELLDTDKLTLSSSASNLQKRIQDLEKENSSNKDECTKLKQLLNKREEQIQYLETEFNEKKSNLEQNRIQLRKLTEEEQTYKKQLEQLEIKGNEIKFKYEKIIKELELKQQNLTENLDVLKEEVENLKIKLEDKVQENFKLNLELKEFDSKLINSKREKEEDEELLMQYREDKSSLVKKLEQNNQELNRFKKLNSELNKLIEIKTTETDQLQSDLNGVRTENIELTNRMVSIKNDQFKQLELVKRSHSNELKQKIKVVDELTQSLNDVKIKLNNLNEEKKSFLKLFTYLENISDPNQQLPVNLNQDCANQLNQMKQQQINLQFEHYLDLIKELKTESNCKQTELNRLKESNRLIENEYEEQKNFLQSIQQKLNSNSSQLKIKDCELIHLKDQLAECKIKRNEDELIKINLMKENENLKDAKSSLELLNLELKQKITNYQLRNVDLENQLQINLNKIIELEKLTNELNEKHQQLNGELNDLNGELVETVNLRDQLDRELKTVHKKIKEIEQMYQNEKELNLKLTETNQQLLNDKQNLEKDLNQLKSDNEQLECDLDKIEKEFKDYESRYKKLIDDRNLLIDLINKYNIILKSHLDPSLQLNCIEFINNRTCLKLIKPEYLIQSLLDVQNEQSKLRRQIESLKMKLNEQKMKLKEESDLNLEYKALIELNETNLMSKRINCEKLFKDQKDFKIQLDQTVKENEKLKIEKNYLTEKVLSLDRLLESTKEFMERKFEETCGNQLIEQNLNNLNKYDLRIDEQNLNLEDIEMRLINMYESLTEFMNVLMKKIDNYKEKVTELTELNAALNDRLNEMNNLIDKGKDKEMNLQIENENLKKELITSNRNSKEVDNKVKQLTNQINDLQNECLTLQNSLESNRLTMNDLIETNNRLKIRIKQLEATINLCEIKIKESEQNLSKKSNQVIGRDSEIITLKSNQNQMQDELKKLQLQNKIMNNELNQTLIKSPKYDRNLVEENLNKFIQFNPDRTIKNSFRHEKFKQEIVKKINIK